MKKCLYMMKHLITVLIKRCLLKNGLKQKKALTSKRILFKKTAIIDRKDEFSKIKGSVCDFP